METQKNKQQIKRRCNTILEMRLDIIRCLTKIETINENKCLEVIATSFYI